MLQFGVLMKSLTCADMSRFDTWPASTPTPLPEVHCDNVPNSKLCTKS